MNKLLYTVHVVSVVNTQIIIKRCISVGILKTGIILVRTGNLMDVVRSWPSKLFIPIQISKKFSQI